jgi:PAS domain S-box-containing protein
MHTQICSNTAQKLQHLIKRQATQLKQVTRQLQTERHRRKQAEAQWQDRQNREPQLQQLAAKLNDILNTANAAISSFRVFEDCTWEDDYYSAGCEDLFGYTAVEMLADRDLWCSRVLEFDLERVICSLFEAFLSEQTISIEYRFRHKDDSLRWIGATYTSRRDDAAACWRVTVVATDISDRKRTEETLRQYERIISATPDGIALVDLDHRYRLVNRTYMAWHRKCREEIIGHSISELLGSTRFETIVKPKFDRCLQGEIVQYEIWIDYHQPRFISVTYVPYLENDGTISGVVFSLRDLTALKRAEEALQQSEERFRLLVNASPVGIFQTDFQGNCIFVNSQWLEMAGLSPEEAMGSGWTRALHPEDIDRIVAEWKDTARTGCEFVAEYRFRTPQGRIRWLQGNAVTVRDARGTITGYLGTIVDITDRKHLELALQAALETASLAEVKLNDVLNTAPVAIVCYRLDRDGNFDYEYCSGACQRVYGYTPEELTRDKALWMSRVLPADVETIILPHFADIFAERQAAYEFRFQHKDGNWRWLSKTLVSRREGNSWIVTAAIADVSDRQRAEAALQNSEAQLRQKAEELEGALEELKSTQTQLVQSEKMSSLGQLVAGVAHEINNPVSFIYGNIEHLNNYIKDLFDLIKGYQKAYPHPSANLRSLEAEIELEFIREDLPKLLLSMQVGSERIRQIVLNLRNFSRLDRAGLLLANLHEGIDNTLLILNHRLKAKSGHTEIQVIRDYGHLPEILCYAGELNQVFMNILSNAIDALEEGMNHGKKVQNPRILIATTATENWVKIRIQDNGSGMPTEVKNKIFDPFFTTKPVGKGTGLGLSISYQIVVKKHGGTLECFSQLDRGTEFLISLPQSSGSCSTYNG